MTSLGYSHPVNEFERFGWPKSLLKITSAICLNEIVNAPDEFVSRKPHLVVAQLDWIQTRYLFVKCAEPGLDLMEEKIPSQVLEQDPTIHPLGTKNEKIAIPVTAISKARRDTATTVKKGNKKSKVASPTQPDNNYLYVSDDTDSQDEKFLNEGNILSDDDDYKLGGVPVPMHTSGVSVVVNNAKKGRKRLLPSRKIGKSAAKQEPLTDFVPGSLDHSKLPKLQPPSYATPQATKAIQRELKATLTAQENNPLHELGWYLDSDLVENVYQWIVELHSFDPSLPLAQDMKARDIKSVVLELRFGKEFPYSPPFVRVIRPRFLPFMMGGGGHVTAGGAMVSSSTLILMIEH
jgi:ubiquitin-conjugating enzyme E2 Q